MRWPWRRHGRSNPGGRCQQQGHGAGDGQGDPGGGLPRPARRGGGDDTKKTGGELARGARGREMAGDVLPGGVDMGRRIERGDERRKRGLLLFGSLS